MPGRAIAASAEVFGGVTKRRSKPAWKIDAALDVIDERPFCRLVRFSRERSHAVPRILLVAALSGHYATLMRGTVEALVAEHDVFVTDWADARDVPLAAGTFDLETYIAYTIDYLRRLGPDVHVVAVCQPVPAVLAAVALMAAHGEPAGPRTMTLMGGSVDTRFHPTAPSLLAAKYSLEWFEKNVITTVPAYYPGAGRRVYPGFMQLAAFISMNTTRHINAHINMYNELVRGDEEAAGTRRHLRARPNGRRARSVFVVDGRPARPSAAARRRALRHLQRPPLARGHRAAHLALHPPALAREGARRLRSTRAADRRQFGRRSTCPSRR